MTSILFNSFDILRRICRRLERFADASQIRLAAPKSSPFCQTVAEFLGEGQSHVLDVGARWGAKDAWWDLTPLTTFIGFEPDKDECEHLNKTAPKGVKYVPKALGAKSETATLHIAKLAGCSSLLNPNPKYLSRYEQLHVMEIQKNVTVPVVTLDEWWEEAGRPNISGIKLDTQGLELDILKGGQKALQSAVAIDVEVEFSALYEGQPLFAEVDTHLREIGFSLWRLKNLCHYSEKVRPETTGNDEMHFDGTWQKMKTGNGRLFWGVAVYLKDYREIVETASIIDYMTLVCYLEQLGDRDGACHALRAFLQRRASELTPAFRATLLNSAYLKA